MVTPLLLIITLFICGGGGGSVNTFYCSLRKNNHSLKFSGMCDMCAVASEVKELDVCSMFLHLLFLIPIYFK